MKAKPPYRAVAGVWRLRPDEQPRQYVEMLKKRRFIKTTSEAGVSFIKDARDDSIVCIMQRAKRPPEHTEAMLRVMLDALNEAVEAKNGCAGQSAPNRA